MEAYKVWVTLNLKGDALKKMEMFAAMTKKATAAVEKLNLVMKPKATMFDHMAVNLRTINPQLNEMSRNIDKIDASSRRASRSVMGRRGMFGRFGMGVATGLGLTNPYIMAGLGGAAILRSGWHQGGEYSRSLGQLSAMGYSNDQLAFAKQFTSQAKPGISQASQIEALVDAQMATQSFAMAKGLAPIIAQNKFASQALYGGMSKKQVQDAIRAAEMIGGSDPTKVAAALTSVLQMTALSGGSLMPSEQRTFLRRSAGASSSLSALGYLGLEPIIQELGGSAAGTAFQTGINQLVAAHMTTQQAKDLTMLGLMSPATYDPSGRRIMSKYGSFKYTKELKTDPFSFLINNLLPAYAKKGITSTDDIQNRIQYDFSRTFANELILMLKNLDKIMRERNLISGLPGGQQISGIAFNTQPGAQLRLTQAFASLTKSINDLTSPTVISGMNAIAFIFEHLANFISSNGLTNVLKSTGSAVLNAIPGGALVNTGLNLIHKKTDVTAGSIKKNTQPIVTHVNIDGKHVATAVANHMSNATFGHQIAHHSTSNLNPLQAYPNAVSQGVG